MPRKRPQIGVQIVGSRFLRFAIADDRQQVWTGNGWSDRRGDALLYAQMEVVRRMCGPETAQEWRQIGLRKTTPENPRVSKPPARAETTDDKTTLT